MKSVASEECQKRIKEFKKLDLYLRTKARQCKIQKISISGTKFYKLSLASFMQSQF